MELAQANSKLEQIKHEVTRLERISHVGTWHLDTASNEVIWSEELYRMYGFDASKPPPPYTEHMKLFTPESWELLSRSLEKTVTEGIPYELELETVRDDGSHGWMWVRGEAELDDQDKVTGLWGAAQDISMRKKEECLVWEAKRKAEQNEADFRRLFENMEQGYAVHEMIYDEAGNPVDYRFILANRAFEKLTQIKVPDCIGKTVREVIPGVEQQFILNYGEVALTGEALHFESYSACLGRHYDVIAYCPRKHYFATVFTDSTKVRHYEQELIEAKNRAEESDRLKSAFLANMSHEIRTPLNAIIGFSSFLADPGSSQDDLTECAEVIHNSGQHLLELINSIIDISKIDSGQMEVEKAPVDINAVCRNVFSLFQSERFDRHKKDIELKLSLGVPDLSFSLNTDDTRLKQVMINLLGNAEKFTEKGEIEFGYQVEGEEVQFFVRDTGIGISEEVKERIFERFRQGYQGTEKLYGGTGLGLSIAKACVELLGGRIWVESREGEGSTFYFTIPCEDLSKQIPAEGDENPTPGFNGELVLVAEDDDLSFGLLSRILKKQNLNCIRAQDGREAIRQCLDNQEVRLVLMDIQMPEVSGVEATKEIRKVRSQLPIIAQTAYAFASDREEFLEAGCDDYISKPISKERLLQLLHQYLHF